MTVDPASILVRDQWLDHPGGRLFSRRWSPPSAGLGAVHGSPILLLHDSLGCVALWRDFPEQLCAATGREVLAYDRLGYGQSDPQRDPPTLDFIADEARVMLPLLRQQLGLLRFVALGHSVGGGMAAHMAAEAGQACEAVVTLAAQAFVEDRTLQGLQAARLQFADPQALERLARYHGDKAGWVLAAWLDTWLDPRFAGWTLAPALHRIACPLLALHGDQDEYGSPQHPLLIQQQAAGAAQAELLPGVGHLPHRECAQRVVGRIVQFLHTTGGAGC